ncbi:MAG: hydroxymethylglutaryl-CoA reductase, degradative [Flavobacteriales bacterium]|nr:hydroxymethylglutaryl-CoA reductase, degradative [Flavobacteriales bacterium]
MNKTTVKGFSKLSKEGKIEWIVNKYLGGDDTSVDLLTSYWHDDESVQKIHDEFIENTITNFYLPFGVAPNFLINDRIYCIPMAIEESSVVAAAAKNASFWMTKGGFKSEVISTTKIGHVHFAWYGDFEKLKTFFDSIKHKFIEETQDLTSNMRTRGGGILDIQILDKTHLEPNYYQIQAKFETCEAMGANFINSLLEEFSKIFERELNNSDFSENDKKLVILMCILSNYTPECLVRCEVSCPVEELADDPSIDVNVFAKKFEQAIHVANIEPYRATTHNKGIFNGIDAVIIATGNDFRAVEACGHTYAAKDGQYRSLTNVEVKDGQFKFWIEIPIAVGTVGGLTSLHPMVKFAHQLLGNPKATDLMKIIAAVGLAQNFGAVRSLVTTGIQKGHMKMHLLNILNQLGATDEEREKIKFHFSDKVVSHKGVVDQFCKLRGIKNISEFNLNS